MEVLIENIAAYSAALLLGAAVLFYYLKKKGKDSHNSKLKLDKAKEEGFHEPVSLHPVVDHDICIGSGACVAACPEQDVLGIIRGRAVTINASRCVGHGACFHACPVEAITLCIGTEKRGVELPHISKEFETNVPGIFIAGELGGMGLIKNAVEQGRQAVEYMSKKIKKGNAEFDVIIVGAGPAGISGTLAAANKGLKYLTLEQDSLGGTVYSFPREKIVMTSPMDLPLHGRIKLSETSKNELLGLWHDVLAKNNISVNQQEKVESIEKRENIFIVKTNKGHYTAGGVLLTIGRRGTPRKLGVPGEEKEKVFYRLLDPELIKNRNILVAGGGDSAVEAALLLNREGNRVTLSYRGDKFSRLKPKNLEKIIRAAEAGSIRIVYNSNIVRIEDKNVVLGLNGVSEINIDNDLVYIFAGGELPSIFLEKIGIKITKKFGEAVMKH